MSETITTEQLIANFVNRKDELSKFSNSSGEGESTKVKDDIQKSTKVEDEVKSEAGDKELSVFEKMQRSLDEIKKEAKAKKVSQGTNLATETYSGDIDVKSGQANTLPTEQSNNNISGTNGGEIRAYVEEGIQKTAALSTATAELVASLANDVYKLKHTYMQSKEKQPEADGLAKSAGLSGEGERRDTDETPNDEMLKKIDQAEKVKEDDALRKSVLNASEPRFKEPTKSEADGVKTFSLGNRHHKNTLLSKMRGATTVADPDARSTMLTEMSDIEDKMMYDGMDDDTRSKINDMLSSTFPGLQVSVVV